MAMLDCPRRENLSDYILGKLSDDTSNSIHEHVKDCLDCLSKLDELNEQEDRIVSAVRRPSPDCRYEREPQCKRMIAKGMEFANELAVPDPETPDLGYLRDYRLVKRIGRGGMGAVYEAIHTHLNRSVALKVLPPDRMQNPQAVARFQREMQAIGKLDHPNIVRAQDAGEADGKHYLVMDRVDGLDLSALTKRLGPLPVADACELIRQAAIGLQHVHEHGLIHRDIKPSNLMVTPDGEVKVLDLGLARLHEDITEGEELTSTGQVMGTLDYMAPEQLGDSHTVDIRADVYGLGATLFKLLSGQAPYAGEKYNTPTKKLVAIATKPARPIQDYRNDVPKGLIVVLNRMFAKNPDDRYTEPGQVAEALRPLANRCDLPRLVAEAIACPEQQAGEAKSSTFDHVSSAMTDTSPTPSISKSLSVAQTSRGVPRRRQPGFIALAACFFFVAVLAIYYVKTDVGMLVVQVDDKDVEVKLKQEGLVVHDLKNDRQWTISTPGETKLPPGEYTLSVTDDAGLKIDTTEFTLTRRGRKIVSISHRFDQPSPDQEPPAIETGEPLSRKALVSRPARIDGVNSLTIETRNPRDDIFSVAHSPDGKWLAAASTDGCVRFWDAATYELVKVIVGRHSLPMGFAWSPDSKHFAIGGQDPFAVDIWDVESGQILCTLNISGSLSWSPDGKHLVVGHSAGIQIHDTKTGEVVHELDAGRCTGPAVWSPDGTLLATSGARGEPTILLWDTRTWQIADTVGRHDGFKSLFWAPDGHALASGAHGETDDARGTIRIWDPIAGEQITSIEPDQHKVHTICWSPDSRRIVAGGYTNGMTPAAEIFDANTGERVLPLGEGWFKGITSSWSPDGEQVVTAGWSSYRGNRWRRSLTELDFWNAETGRLERTINGHYKNTYYGTALFSPNSTLIAWGVRNNVEVWNVVTATRVWKKVDETGDGSLLAWSPAGDVLAVASRRPIDRIHLFDAKTGDRTGAKTLIEHQGVRSLTWVDDGNFLVAACDDDKLRVWDARDTDSNRPTKIWDGPTEGIGVIQSSPDGSVLASAGHTDGTIKIWDIASAKVVRSLANEGNHTWLMMRWCPNGVKLAVAGHDTDDQYKWKIRVWDTRTGRRLHEFPTNDIGSMFNIAWSADAGGLTAVFKNDVAVKWEIKSGKRKEVRGGKAGFLSTDGSVCTSRNGTALQLWNTGTGQPLKTLVSLRDSQWLALSPEGNFHGSPGIEEMLVYVVETDNGQQTLTPAEFAKAYGGSHRSNR